MKNVLVSIFSMLSLLSLQAQTEYSTLRLTYFMDQLRFEVPNQNRYWIMSKTQTDSKAFALYSPEDGGWFTYWKEGSGDMILNKGRLGIGTASPQAELHVASGENGGLVIGRPNDNMGLNGGRYDIKFYGYRDIKGNVYSAKISAERTNVCCSWLHQGTDLTFHTTNSIQNANADNSVERMRITGSGNVGIGTTNTFGYKLAVNGAIGSKEVVVETTSAWPDFVFEPHYDLPTLEEVEQHIADQGHLPEIPSEAEVTENGINLGEMNAKLLQKIEELTLYLIDQNKQNQEQQARIEKLELINSELLKKLGNQ